jgi:hypothetical protein
MNDKTTIVLLALSKLCCATEARTAKAAAAADIFPPIERAADASTNVA